MGELENSLEYQLKSYEIRKQLPQQRELAISMNRLGEIYMKLGQYKTSGDYLNDALQLSKKTESKPEILFSYEQFANLHEIQGNFAQANKYLKKVIELKDSILNEDKLKQINELEIRYETAKKDQEIQLLSKENEVKEARARQQNILRNGLIGTLILICALAFSIYQSLKQKLKNQRQLSEKNEENKLSNYKRKMTDLELKALRSQMNPHFIFNCMNSINRMILGGDGVEASRYLTKFAKLIRLTLEKSENNTVTLEDELSMLEAYIQLESIRFKGKINYSISVDDSIDQSAISLPSMVLQPFIENAIWHGLMHKKEPGNIFIKIHEEEDILKCTIEDDGVGREMALKMKDELDVKNKSMGLKITEERLRLIFKEQLGELIQINDLKDALNNPLGTQVNISIPIN
jgi:LytS/YehU family sensor histidine kinase